MMSRHRLCMYPEPWALVKLGSIAESEKGKKPKSQTDQQSPSHSVPYIDIQAFEKGIISSWTDGDNCRGCHESDLLIVWDGSRSGLVGKGIKGALGSTLARVNFPLMENQYALYFLQSKYEQINSRTKGSGTPHVDPALLWNYEFPIPPLNEQRRIVARIEELFSELDSGVDSLKKAREQLKTYRQAVLKHAFAGKLTAHWREKNRHRLEKPEQLLARIKQERAARHEQRLEEWKMAVNTWKEVGKSGKRPTPPPKPQEILQLSPTEKEALPPLPASWPYLRLGLVIDEPKYGSSKKCDYDYKGTGVLRIPNVVRGLVDASDLKGADFDEDEKRTYDLRKGDILVVRSNGSISIVGKCALISRAEENYLYAGYLIRLRSNLAALLPEYLAALLSSHRLRTQIENKAKSTSGVNNINSREIQSLIIPMCSLSEQKVVSEGLSTRTSEINATQAAIDSSLQKAEALRQAILKESLQRSARCARPQG